MGILVVLGVFGHEKQSQFIAKQACPIRQAQGRL